MIGNPCVRRVVDIAAACGVSPVATARLACRHGISLYHEPGYDSLGRRRRVLVVYRIGGQADRLEALHRARAERWPAPAPARERIPEPRGANAGLPRAIRVPVPESALSGPEYVTERDSGTGRTDAPDPEAALLAAREREAKAAMQAHADREARAMAAWDRGAFGMRVVRWI